VKARKLSGSLSGSFSAGFFRRGAEMLPDKSRDAVAEFGQASPLTMHFLGDVREVPSRRQPLHDTPHLAGRMVSAFKIRSGPRAEFLMAAKATVVRGPIVDVVPMDMESVLSPTVRAAQACRMQQRD
jgi:hypothetical protein